MADPLSATYKVEQVEVSTQSRVILKNQPNTSTSNPIGNNPVISRSQVNGTGPNVTNTNPGSAHGNSNANALAAMRARQASQRQQKPGVAGTPGQSASPASTPSDERDQDEGMEGWKPASKNQAIDMDTLRLKIGKSFEVQVGKRTVIEPNVTIIAEGGSIIIGVDNIISEGTWIINKSDKGEPIQIGSGNLFEPNARIEAAKIGSFNVFGSKCHVKQGVVIGNGCVIGPRVMVIQNTRIRKDIVVFGDNMMHEQPLMTKRNRSYIHQMVIMLNKTWMEQKQASDSAAGGQSKRALTSRSQTDRSERVSTLASQVKPTGQAGTPGSVQTPGQAQTPNQNQNPGQTPSTTTVPGIANQSQNFTPKGPMTTNRAGNYPAGSRAETPMNKTPSSNPQNG